MDDVTTVVIGLYVREHEVEVRHESMEYVPAVRLKSDVRNFRHSAAGMRAAAVQVGRWLGVELEETAHAERDRLKLEIQHLRAEIERLHALLPTAIAHDPRTMVT